MLAIPVATMGLLQFAAYPMEKHMKKIVSVALTTLLLAPMAGALAQSANADITSAREARIIAEAKIGQAALRRYVTRLVTFNVNVDFDRALALAQNACMRDAAARGTDVWRAARQADSACNGWVVRTFDPTTEESRSSMLAYLDEIGARRHG